MRFPAVATVLFLFCQHSSALDDASQFTIKQVVPRAGSSILRDEVVSSHIPLNKRYSELSDEEKRVVRSAYEAMAPDDEPPYPAAGLMRISRAMRDGQEKLLETGELSMVVRVDSKGEARSIEVMSTPSEKMTQFAAAVLMTEKYKPALCRGVPCMMDFPYRITFSVAH